MKNNFTLYTIVLSFPKREMFALYTSEKCSELLFMHSVEKNIQICRLVIVMPLWLQKLNGSRNSTDAVYLLQGCDQQNKTPSLFATLKRFQACKTLSEE